MRIEYVVNDFDENNLIGFLDKMIIAIETNDKLNEYANILTYVKKILSSKFQ